MGPWLAAFLLTQCVEIPVYLRALSDAPPRSNGQRLAIAAGLSALTHPVVFFGFPRLFPTDYWTGVAAAEAFAVAVEGALLTRAGVERGLVWALLANGLSVAVGLGSRALFGWP